MDYPGVKHLTIKSLAEDDRPREKLVAKGRQTLSDAELIAILLRSGSRDETALQLAQKLLSSSKNSIHDLAKLQISDLRKFKGVGLTKAVTIAAALELGRRRADSNVLEKSRVLNSQQAFQYIYPRLTDLPHEEFWVLYLNRANLIIRSECVSKGGVSGTLVDVRLILKPAIECLASSIILAHNHPSGNIIPSQHDLLLTRKVKDAAKLMDVNVQDHIIIGENTYYSFSDQGTL